MVVDELLCRVEKARQGVNILPKKGQPSEMPAKDEEFFADVPYVNNFHHPQSFIRCQESGDWSWHGMTFPIAMLRNVTYGKM